MKLYSVYSSYLKLLENYCEQSVVLESIHYVVCKAEENLPMEVQWRLYVEVAQLYHRFDMPLEEKKFLKAALQFAPANVKWKPYLMIIKALNLEPQTVGTRWLSSNSTKFGLFEVNHHYCTTSTNGSITFTTAFLLI